MIFLSDAIRLGSTFGPQIQGRMIGPTIESLRGNEDGQKPTCAWGGAVLAADLPIRGYSTDGIYLRDKPEGGKAVFAQTILLPKEWEFALTTKRHCPMCGKEDLVGRLISHLNDEYRQTRDQIADFVQQVEWEVGVRVESKVPTQEQLEEFFATA